MGEFVLDARAGRHRNCARRHPPADPVAKSATAAAAMTTKVAQPSRLERRPFVYLPMIARLSAMRTSRYPTGRHRTPRRQGPAPSPGGRPATARWPHRWPQHPPTNPAASTRRPHHCSRQRSCEVQSPEGKPRNFAARSSKKEPSFIRSSPVVPSRPRYEHQLDTTSAPCPKPHHGRHRAVGLTFRG